MARFEHDNDGVVVIIGSGAGGGTLANELCQKGIDVVLLEAGKRHTVDDFINDEWASFVQLAWLDKRTTSGSWRVARDFRAGRCVYNAAMRILLSNDDGYLAPGLAALARATRAVADIDVVAPERDRSGASNSLTLDHPLTVRRSHNGYYYVNGTPTDCVILALNKLLPAKPDLVVSGINRGGNMGENVYYSGTLGAAMEGVINGIPGIAVSVAHRGEGFHYDDAARFARRLVEVVLREGLPAGVLLNVNVPNQWRGGVRLARQSKKITRTLLREGVDATGRPCYWLAEQPVGEPDAGSDYAAVLAGDIAVTPLLLDRTDCACLGTLAKWVEMLEEKS